MASDNVAHPTGVDDSVAPRMPGVPAQGRFQPAGAISTGACPASGFPRRPDTPARGYGAAEPRLDAIDRPRHSRTGIRHQWTFGLDDVSSIPEQRFPACAVNGRDRGRRQVRGVKLRVRHYPALQSLANGTWPSHTTFRFQSCRHPVSPSRKSPLRSTLNHFQPRRHHNLYLQVKRHAIALNI